MSELTIKEKEIKDKLFKAINGKGNRVEESYDIFIEELENIIYIISKNEDTKASLEEIAQIYNI